MKKLRKKLKLVIAIFIVISIIWIINISRSRYLLETNVKSNLDVAIPQTALVGENVSIDSMLPGDTRSYDFYVNNYENGQTNEILMEYYLNVNVIEGNLPLTYKIYEVNGANQTELSKNEKGYGPTQMNYETQESKQYRIVFTWDEHNNSDTYANQNYTFQIQVNSIQVI